MVLQRGRENILGGECIVVRGDTISVLALMGRDMTDTAAPLLDYLSTVSLMEVSSSSVPVEPEELHKYDVLILFVTESAPIPNDEHLGAFVRLGKGCVALVQPSTSTLPRIFSTEVGRVGPLCELTMSFPDPHHPLASRLPTELSIEDHFQPLERQGDISEMLLMVNWQYQSFPIAVSRMEGKGKVACLSLHAYDKPIVQQISHRIIRYVAGIKEGRAVNTALVGYGPVGSIGYFHALALNATPGLRLCAICDSSPQRLALASTDFPSVTLFDNTSDMSKDEGIDAVIISTPPNSHASLATRFLNEGKHVICEKPLCITRQDADAMMETADRNHRTLTCHQNRRWDPDYIAIRDAVRKGVIGQPFYLESFVGDYAHPCAYWHSHEPISGGALYDWGAHYIDWILDLFPSQVDTLIGTSHKRVWYDVTNADQTRIRLHFSDGCEAEFLQSDIAAIRKPKWYILGSKGAIVADWEPVSVYEHDPVFYLKEEKIPVTETLPSLIVRSRNSSNVFVDQRLPVLPTSTFPFHTNLADHLLYGEPLAITARSAARVVAVIEAAQRSAKRGASLERLDI